jgi:ssDNA thymidine ADP-ribosyltransferase, DarT
MYTVGEKIFHKVYKKGIVTETDSKNVSILFENGHLRKFLIEKSNKFIERFGEFKFFCEETNNWYNQNGYDKDGYNIAGYNKEGYNREDYNINGYNKKGYNKLGFNKDGVHQDTGTKYNLNGYNLNGTHESDVIMSYIKKRINHYRCEIPFDGFYHMTSFENLYSILKEGKFYPREKSRMVTDMISIIPKTENTLFESDTYVQNFVRLYFRPKTPTFWHFESYGKMVLIKLSPKLLSLEGAKISRGRAGREDSILGSPKDNTFLDQVDFNLLFKSSAPPSDKVEKNMRHTELLIPNNLPISFVDTIIFKSTNDLRLFRQEYGWNAFNKVSHTCDSSMFFMR